MIPVAEALDRILADLAPTPAEIVSVAQGWGRVLTEDLTARTTQPPSDMSAMDGWAVRATDVASPPALLRRIGTAPAGRPFHGRVGPGECVRIFTGGYLPEGADTIVIQENAEEREDGVTIHVGEAAGRSVRREGLDFSAGATVVPAGRRLTARDVGLAAAAGLTWLPVRRRPRIALLATGDEVVRPGDPLAPGQIVSANGYALAALVRAAGGEPVDLGIAPDDRGALAAAAAAARGCDMLVTTGGASVGEHDLIQAGLGDAGLAVDFWKIAMRPGKPLIHGRLGDIPFLGLPGNPVSALVCAFLFLRPALDRLSGAPTQDRTDSAVLTAPLAANDRRQDHLRARFGRDAEGRLTAQPFALQDSAMMSILAAADGLILRPPHAPAAAAGDRVPVLRFDLDHPGI